ncbi:MAG: phage tail assembly protein [Gammaproteobacteria bacterium]|nr:phage tail assembly protein [Alphaproteobacteria bacterium]MBU2407120.1 phage tail assembly protein [Gammaproteobacteria bacterium]
MDTPSATSAPSPATAQPRTAETAPVTLNAPVVRGETTITDLTLRKPKAGDLRGLTLQDVLQSDVAALIKLLPRISSPALTEHEASELEADDLAEIGGTVFGFFMTPAQKAVIKQLTG